MTSQPVKTVSTRRYPEAVSCLRIVVLGYIVRGPVGGNVSLMEQGRL